MSAFGAESIYSGENRNSVRSSPLQRSFKPFLQQLSQLSDAHNAAACFLAQSSFSNGGAALEHAEFHLEALWNANRSKKFPNSWFYERLFDNRKANACATVGKWFNCDPVRCPGLGFTFLVVGNLEDVTRLLQDREGAGESLLDSAEKNTFVYFCIRCEDDVERVQEHVPEFKCSANAFEWFVKCFY